MHTPPSLRVVEPGERPEPRGLTLSPSATEQLRETLALPGLLNPAGRADEAALVAKAIELRRIADLAVTASFNEPFVKACLAGGARVKDQAAWRRLFVDDPVGTLAAMGADHTQTA